MMQHIVSSVVGSIRLFSQHDPCSTQLCNYSEQDCNNFRSANTSYQLLRSETTKKLCSLSKPCCVCLYPQGEECHLPGLGVALTLDYKPETPDEAVSPLVSYVSGLLLGTNSKVRTWFSMFIRNGQQVRDAVYCI